ncbi:GPW/gp25 family protein [Trinickia dinghuensis]|uniref:Baseplate assembly protein n=1 Tax=Trinickia dinghuensis TaxID=2291023 RepID=A0A3D8JWU1_9BURK|nr:GPW/gp25 family protein [Trinickia dinghuensis]RDU97340.1 baseplate assembly protein [Trinickia dinghuensis]
MLINNDFLGRGFSFPLKVVKDYQRSRSTLEWANEQEDIRQAVWIILATAPGERVMNPTFGCRLQELVFAERNAATRALAERYVRQSLAELEPRIDIDQVAVTYDGANGGGMQVSIDYTVTSTNRPDNIVFPFTPFTSR